MIIILFEKCVNLGFSVISYIDISCILWYHVVINEKKNSHISITGDAGGGSTYGKEKEKNYRLSLVISILIAACLFVADLYIMINMPQNVLALVAVNVLFLAAIYYVIDAVTRQISAAAESQGRTV